MLTDAPPRKANRVQSSKVTDEDARPAKKWAFASDQKSIESAMKGGKWSDVRCARMEFLGAASDFYRVPNCARPSGLGQRRIEGLKRVRPPRGKQPEVYASLQPPSYRSDSIADCWRKIAWLLKNARFEKLGEIWGGRKCLAEQRRSFVGPPDTTFFPRISRT
jgi:hypothetical protein